MKIPKAPKAIQPAGKGASWLIIVVGVALLALAWSTKLKGVLKLFAGVVGFGLILVNGKTIIAQLKGVGKAF
jgi:hypothetical protein